MTSPTAEQFLSQGSKSASFKGKPIGYSYAGTITEPPKVTQQTDIDSGEPLTWPSGEPKWQLIVKIQTDLRDDNDDDGVRTAYIKGKSLTDATKAATKAAGVKALAVGGVLSITYVGDGEATNKKYDPPKLYTVGYVPPADRAVESFLAGGGVPGGNVAAAAAVANSIPMAPKGFDPSLWASMDAEARGRILAAMSAPAAAADGDAPPY